MLTRPITATDGATRMGAPPRLPTPRRTPFLAVMALLLGVGLVTPVRAATQGATPAPSPAADRTVAVLAYFLDEDEQVVPVRRVIEVGPNRAVGATTLRALLEGPTREETDAGLTSSIDEETELLDLDIDAESKVATADITDPVAEGNVAPTAAIAQIAFTLTQFPSIEEVRVLIDGEPVDETVEGAAGERFALAEPQARDAFEGFSPLVLIESPAPGDEVARTFRVRGTANTFEAAFALRVVDADGVAVLDQPETATSGSGTRGTFATVVRLPAAMAPGPFTLVAYELSARDGGELIHAEVPLELEG